MILLTHNEGIEIKRRIQEKGRTPVILRDFYSRELVLQGYTDSTTVNETGDERTLTFYEYTTQQRWEGGRSREDFCRTMGVTYECKTGILTYYVGQWDTQKRSQTPAPITLIKPSTKVLL